MEKEVGTGFIDYPFEGQEKVLLYPLEYVYKLDKLIKEIYSDPQPIENEPSHPIKRKHVPKKLLSEVSVEEWYLLRLLMEGFSCYLCKNMAS